MFQKSQVLKSVLFFFITFCGFFSIVSAGPTTTQEGQKIPSVLKQKKGPSLSKSALKKSVENLVFEKTLQARRDERRGGLRFHSLLQKVGRRYSEDMLRRGYFSHLSPEGHSILDRLKQVKPSYNESCGENLHVIFASKGLTDSAAISDQILEDWLHSPSHRKNLLAQEYTWMAVGCATDGFRILCTQIFSGAEI